MNLAVADLERSRAFFEALGFSINRQFSNDEVAALPVSNSIHAMLHTPECFRRFTPKEIPDARRTTEAMLALEVESREQVDELAGRGLAAGGREPRGATDHGFMYERAFEDPDGHIWEVYWIDEAAVPR